MKFAFILFALLVITPYVIYPALLYFWARIKNRKVNSAPITPEVTLLIAAYNEEKSIRKKIENSLALNYPKGLMTIAVVTDGSDDATCDIVREFENQGVQLLHDTARRGKFAAIVRVWDQLEGKIVVLSDANNLYNSEAILEMVKNFNDPEVGGVCGEKMILEDEDDLTPVSRGEGLYWRFERFVKLQESRIDSICGAMGEIFALRKELFERPEKNNIVDDSLFISLHVTLKGFRLIWEPKAQSFEKASITLRDEFDRKARIVAAALQTLPRVSGILHPLKSRIWLQMIFHKIIKWFVPVFMALAFWTNAMIPDPAYRLIFAGQIAFYSMAMAYPVFAIIDRRIKLFYYPFFFCLGNLAALAGIIKWMLNKQSVEWKRFRRG